MGPNESYASVPRLARVCASVTPLPLNLWIQTKRGERSERGNAGKKVVEMLKPKTYFLFYCIPFFFLECGGGGSGG